MLGWKLFKHALRMIFGNWREVLRIFLVPTIVGILGIVAFIAVFADRLEASGPVGSGIGLAIFSVMIFYAIVATWSIVAWHRFVLLEEIPQGWIPPFNIGRIFSYWWQMLKITLLAIVVGLPVGVLLVSFVEVSLPIAILIGLPVYFLLIVSYMRLSILLPAAAIGAPISIGKAFEATKGFGGSFLLLLLSLIGFQILLQLPVSLTTLLFAPLSAIFSVVAAVLATLLNISVLTTLHGHFIEGRSVD